MVDLAESRHPSRYWMAATLFVNWCASQCLPRLPCTWLTLERTVPSNASGLMATWAPLTRIYKPGLCCQSFVVVAAILAATRVGTSFWVSVVTCTPGVATVTGKSVRAVNWVAIGAGEAARIRAWLTSIRFNNFSLHTFHTVKRTLKHNNTDITSWSLLSQTFVRGCVRKSDQQCRVWKVVPNECEHSRQVHPWG